MSSRRAKNNFILYMFQQDLDNMKKWVLNYPNRETGGDLFGLWSDEGNAVIHVVLGPGRHCTHGNYHFYQDVSYLEKVGTLLTRDYMLGHIGEWHSHHQLRLDEPSEGDCRTVQRNFPQGACGFFLMIANIITKDEVTFSPYIFRGSEHYRAGQIKAIGNKSPFSLVTKISLNLEDGKEAENKTCEAKNDFAREGSGQKFGFWNDLKNAVSGVIFDEEPAKHIEGRPTNSHEKLDTSLKSTAIFANMPPNTSFQWYSKVQSREVLIGIYCGLSKIANIEINFDEQYPRDLNMIFVYGKYEIILTFPNRFPSSPARIFVNKTFRTCIFFRNRFTIQSFDLNEFLMEVERFLQTLLNDPTLTSAVNQRGYRFLNDTKNRE